MEGLSKELNQGDSGSIIWSTFLVTAIQLALKKNDDKKNAHESGTFAQQAGQRCSGIVVGFLSKACDVERYI